MTYPHDYYGPDDRPHLHGPGQGSPYIDPDYIANECDDQLPVLSTIGRGPRGDGIFVRLIAQSETEFAFALVSDATGETVQQSPNLSAGKITITQPTHTPVAGETTSMDVHITRGSATETYTVNLPAGATGSVIFAYCETIPRNNNDIYQFDLARLDYRGTPTPPHPRPNDIVVFHTKKDKSTWITFGYVTSVTNGFAIVTAKNYFEMIAWWGNIQGELRDQGDLSEELDRLDERVDDEAQAREEADESIKENWVPKADLTQSQDWWKGSSPFPTWNGKPFVNFFPLPRWYSYNYSVHEFRENGEDWAIPGFAAAYDEDTKDLMLIDAEPVFTLPHATASRYGLIKDVPDNPYPNPQAYYARTTASGYNLWSTKPFDDINAALQAEENARKAADELLIPKDDYDGGGSVTDTKLMTNLTVESQGTTIADYHQRLKVAKAYYDDGDKTTGTEYVMLPEAALVTSLTNPKGIVALSPPTSTSTDQGKYAADAYQTFLAIEDAIASITAGGLKLPISLEKESDLPTTGQQDGDYYIIEDMDVTAPGHSGRAWWNSAESTTTWQVVVDQYHEPDMTSISLSGSGQLQVDSGYMEGQLEPLVPKGDFNQGSSGDTRIMGDASFSNDSTTGDLELNVTGSWYNPNDDDTKYSFSTDHTVPYATDTTAGVVRGSDEAGKASINSDGTINIPDSPPKDAFSSNYPWMYAMDYTQSTTAGSLGLLTTEYLRYFDDDGDAQTTTDTDLIPIATNTNFGVVKGSTSAGKANIAEDGTIDVPVATTWTWDNETVIFTSFIVGQTVTFNPSWVIQSPRKSNGQLADTMVGDIIYGVNDVFEVLNPTATTNNVKLIEHRHFQTMSQSFRKTDTPAYVGLGVIIYVAGSTIVLVCEEGHIYITRNADGTYKVTTPHPENIIGVYTWITAGAGGIWIGRPDSVDNTDLNDCRHSFTLLSYKDATGDGPMPARLISSTIQTSTFPAVNPILPASGGTPDLDAVLKAGNTSEEEIVLGQTDSTSAYTTTFSYGSIVQSASDTSDPENTRQATAMLQTAIDDSYLEMANQDGSYERYLQLRTADGLSGHSQNARGFEEVQRYQLGPDNLSIEYTRNSDGRRASVNLNPRGEESVIGYASHFGSTDITFVVDAEGSIHQHQQSGDEIDSYDLEYGNLMLRHDESDSEDMEFLVVLDSSNPIWYNHQKTDEVTGKTERNRLRFTEDTEIVLTRQDGNADLEQYARLSTEKLGIDGSDSSGSVDITLSRNGLNIAETEIADHTSSVNLSGYNLSLSYEMEGLPADTFNLDVTAPEVTSTENVHKAWLKYLDVVPYKRMISLSAPIVSGTAAYNWRIDDWCTITLMSWSSTSATSTFSVICGVGALAPGSMDIRGISNEIYGATTGSLTYTPFGSSTGYDIGAGVAAATTIGANRATYVELNFCYRYILTGECRFYDVKLMADPGMNNASSDGNLTIVAERTHSYDDYIYVED